MPKRRIGTGNRFGDALLVVVFLMIAGVGILTTGLLLQFDAGSAALGDAKVPQQALTPALVIMGDSLAQGVGASAGDKNLGSRLFAAEKEKKSNLRLWNFGVAGALAAQVASEQLPRLAAVQVQELYIVVGANDVTRQTDPQQFRAAMGKIMDAAVASKAQVTLLNVPKLSSTPAVPERLKAQADERTKLLNVIIAEEAAKRSSIRIFDFYTYSAEKLFAGENVLSEDKFHPNDQGYAALAQAILAK